MRSKFYLMHTTNAMNIIDLVVWITEDSDDRGSTVLASYPAGGRERPRREHHIPLAEATHYPIDIGWVAQQDIKAC